MPESYIHTKVLHSFVRDSYLKMTNDQKTLNIRASFSMVLAYALHNHYNTFLSFGSKFDSMKLLYNSPKHLNDRWQERKRAQKHRERMNTEHKHGENIRYSRAHIKEHRVKDDKKLEKHKQSTHAKKSTMSQAHKDHEWQEHKSTHRLLGHNSQSTISKEHGQFFFSMTRAQDQRKPITQVVFKRWEHGILQYQHLLLLLSDVKVHRHDKLSLAGLQKYTVSNVIGQIASKQPSQPSSKQTPRHASQLKGFFPPIKISCLWLKCV